MCSGCASTAPSAVLHHDTTGRHRAVERDWIGIIDCEQLSVKRPSAASSTSRSARMVSPSPFPISDSFGANTPSTSTSRRTFDALQLQRQIRAR